MKPIIKILLSLRKAPTVPNQKNQNQVKVLRKVGVANRVDAVVHLNPINSHVLSIATFDFLSTLKRTAGTLSGGFYFMIACSVIPGSCLF